MPNPTTDAAESAKPDNLLTTAQLAEKWQLSPLTLEAWRNRKIGPPWIKLGPGSSSGVRYRLDDILAWEAANRQAGRP